MPPLAQWARWESPRRFHGTRRRGCVVSRLLVRTVREGIEAGGCGRINKALSSPQDAPHRLQTHRKKRRAGHLEKRSGQDQTRDRSGLASPRLGGTASAGFSQSCPVRQDHWSLAQEPGGHAMRCSEHCGPPTTQMTARSPDIPTISLAQKCQGQPNKRVLFTTTHERTDP